jgi:hypothetical protein
MLHHCVQPVTSPAAPHGSQAQITAGHDAYKQQYHVLHRNYTLGKA